MGERPVVEVRQRVDGVRRGGQVLGPGAADGEGVRRPGEPVAGPALLGDPAGHLEGAVVRAVVDQDDVLDRLEHRRQHPRQVPRLVLDPEHAGQSRLEGTVVPGPADVVLRDALAAGDVGVRAWSDALIAPGPAPCAGCGGHPRGPSRGRRAAPGPSRGVRVPGSSRGTGRLAGSVRGQCGGGRDRFGLAVVVGVRRPQLVELIVDLGGVPPSGSASRLRPCQDSSAISRRRAGTSMSSQVSWTRRRPGSMKEWTARTLFAEAELTESRSRRWPTPASGMVQSSSRSAYGQGAGGEPRVPRSVWSIMLTQAAVRLTSPNGRRSTPPCCRRPR